MSLAELVLYECQFKFLQDRNPLLGEFLSTNTINGYNIIQRFAERISDVYYDTKDFKLYNNYFFLRKREIRQERMCEIILSYAVCQESFNDTEKIRLLVNEEDVRGKTKPLLLETKVFKSARGFCDEDIAPVKRLNFERKRLRFKSKSTDFTADVCLDTFNGDTPANYLTITGYGESGGCFHYVRTCFIRKTNSKVVQCRIMPFELLNKMPNAA